MSDGTKSLAKQTSVETRECKSFTLGVKEQTLLLDAMNVEGMFY